MLICCYWYDSKEPLENIVGYNNVCVENLSETVGSCGELVEDSLPASLNCPNFGLNNYCTSYIV